MSVNFNLNKALIAGRLVRDPELKAIGEDNFVCSFTVAINRDYVGADGNRETDFIRCTVFKQQAQFVSRYFHKGDPIYAEGSIRVDNYEKDGEKRSQIYLKADQIRFVEGIKKPGTEDPAPQTASVPESEGSSADQNLPEES